jgi:hypothetical protein
MCSRSARYGSGHARNRNASGKRSGTRALVPKSSTTPPAAKSGNVRRSRRIAQKYFDQCAGPMAIEEP